MSFAKGVLIGNLGGAPEFRHTPGGDGVCNFSVAVNEYRGKGEARTQTTTWFRVNVWGKLGEVCAQLEKGAKVYLEGRLSIRSYTDRSGHTRDAVEITAERVEFLSPRAGGQTHTTPAQPGDTPEYHGPDGSDDIPF